jgi:aldehyde dehydrogenase (NAD+)
MSGHPVLGLGELLIGDRRIHNTSIGRSGHVNPATGQVQADITLAGPEEIDLAVATARAALADWRSWHAADRRDVILRIADIIDAHAVELGEIGVLENGTPTSFAAFACAGAPAGWFRYYAGWADKLEGRSMPSYPANGLNYTPGPSPSIRTGWRTR